MRGIAIAGLCLAGAAVIAAAWAACTQGVGCPPFGTGSPARFEIVALPDGVSGGAIHVAAHDPVRATCWGDGSVTIRRRESVSRVPPPSDGSRYRRVAVPADGIVFALTTRGGLYDLSQSPPRRLAVKGIQAGANIAAGGESDDLWIGGESGALIRVRRPGETVEADDQGDPSITSLVVGPGRVPTVEVRRADGTVTEFTERGSGAPRADRQPTAVAVVELNGIWAAVLESGEVVTYRSRPIEKDGSERRDLLHSTPHAACAIEGGTAILVATDAGERIVRFAR